MDNDWFSVESFQKLKTLKLCFKSTLYMLITNILNMYQK